MNARERLLDKAIARRRKKLWGWRDRARAWVRRQLTKLFARPQPEHHHWSAPQVGSAPATSPARLVAELREKGEAAKLEALRVDVKARSERAALAWDRRWAAKRAAAERAAVDRRWGMEK